MIDRIREFIVERFAQPCVATSLLDADQVGYTWEEYERLQLRGGPQFPLIRAAMKTGGRLSNGIDLGWQQRFRFRRDARLRLRERAARLERRSGGSSTRLTSTASAGAASGSAKCISSSCCARRSRRRMPAGRPVRILDIAAGGGRYVLETLARAARTSPMTAVLRDYKQENVDAARPSPSELGLDERDRRSRRTPSIAARSPRSRRAPTIGIVSGLYELFPVQRSRC